ncbi:aldehyde dehydrogenase (NADP(+)) [Roseibium sp. RKSG952]|uniref:aldehyde dehydrogenase (NADP(+)) n=1 Tax=Roseibium sp. RKSG952 TaxID=2529384 RepID=UPI0012BD0EF8|nr:aldehyde dehydrogenase (NADP(+)) [Roseibium sp. RKSG952]MTH95437.1 aldehyde dehydrogenase (NADP(+)) [Roseibium sp. RKSG952]
MKTPEHRQTAHLAASLTGRHFILGRWVGGTTTFASSPASGSSMDFAQCPHGLVDTAAAGAEAAFETYGWLTRAERAAFLQTIADEIDARKQEIVDIASNETGLPTPRLSGEHGRTVNQLRQFAKHLEIGGYLDLRHDQAQPERKEAPRPDLRLIQRPIGPVVVFGASNFPLAFSVAGGDTAAALAAGCPVIVKGHPAHPGTSETVARAIEAAVLSSKIEPGVFSLIQGDQHQVGEWLVQHKLITAVGFTGSLRGGRALFDLCARRANPIPFYGELGSINPILILPGAMMTHSTEIGKGWAASLSQGVGQFCTNPGVAVIPEGPDGDAMIAAAVEGLVDANQQIMLTDGIAKAYREGTERIAAIPGATELVKAPCHGRHAVPHLYMFKYSDWQENPVLQQEVFGPVGIAVRTENLEQMYNFARNLEGQLTCTLHLDGSDFEAAQTLLPVLERKAGRVIVNGFPTGVEVCDSMVHGGPYPASTNFGATSVGTLSIRRFLRPVCYQDFPERLLPETF